MTLNYKQQTYSNITRYKQYENISVYTGQISVFPILHVAEMWKRADNNLIQVALVFIPFRQGK